MSISSNQELVIRATEKPKTLLGPLAVLGAGLLIAGCSTAQSVQDKEGMLLSSGFQQRPAETAKQQAMMERLPPHTLVKRDRNGKPVYIYSDPTGCHCIYVGTQAAFERYHQMRHGQENVYAGADPDWDWMPWGMTGWRD